MFVDTSAWYAAADSADPDHATIVAWLRGNDLPLVASNYVLDETLTLIRYRLGHGAAVRFGQSLRASRIATLVAVTGADEEDAWRRFERARDKKWSFTDCTSFSLMTRLKIATACALDDDFRQAGFQLVPK